MAAAARARLAAAARSGGRRWRRDWEGGRGGAMGEGARDADRVGCESHTEKKGRE